jgi:hypothetical protein
MGCASSAPKDAGPHGALVPAGANPAAGKAPSKGKGAAAASPPDAKSLKTAQLSKVQTVDKTKVGAASEDMKPFMQLWNDNKGNMAAIKKDKRFKDSKWSPKFQPKSADAFARGILEGAAFVD